MGAPQDDSNIARLVYKARLAEQAERFDEMCDLMCQVVKHQKSLEGEEQKLLAIAFKNRVGRVRIAWKLADTTRAKYKGKDPKKETFAAQYAEELASEILSICREVESVLAVLANSARSPESEALYAKINADFRRYRAELEPKEKTNASDAYKRAMSLAQNLPVTHPTRMGVALNYSVFKYEIENQIEDACQIAQAPLDDYRKEGGVSSNRDCHLIQQLLRDNIDLWTSEQRSSQQQLVE